MSPKICDCGGMKAAFTFGDANNTANDAKKMQATGDGAISSVACWLPE